MDSRHIRPRPHPAIASAYVVVKTTFVFFVPGRACYTAQRARCVAFTPEAFVFQVFIVAGQACVAKLRGAVQGWTRNIACLGPNGGAKPSRPVRFFVDNDGLIFELRQRRLRILFQCNAENSAAGKYESEMAGQVSAAAALLGALLLLAIGLGAKSVQSEVSITATGHADAEKQLVRGRACDLPFAQQFLRVRDAFACTGPASRHFCSSQSAWLLCVPVFGLQC